ncbi:unnamed protein product, partial [Didymodactylos carnosus]
TSKRNESVGVDNISPSTLSPKNNRICQLSEFILKVETGSVYDEFDSIPLCRMTNNNLFQDGRLSENIERNRFPDVIPYDDTRVRLIPVKENLQGYINASHVKIRIQNTIYSYIATESPLPLTIYDFWRMISLNNIHVVVMLIGDFIENDHQICARYFPLKKENILRTNEVRVF